MSEENVSFAGLCNNDVVERERRWISKDLFSCQCIGIRGEEEHLLLLVSMKR